MDNPNNLTILINTRIRGYPKIKYTPSMTIPGVKSKSVFFDPLIKLSESAVTNPEQFFNKGEFDSLLSRTISSSYLGQSRVDIDKATKNGYIDNNIKVTLKQLFKPNSVFYINEQPFTINNYEWNKGDWIIDTKSFEKEFQNLNNYGKGFHSLIKYDLTKTEEALAEKELVEFKKKHPESVKGEINKNNSQLAPYYEAEEGVIGELSGVGRGLNEPTSIETKSVEIEKDYKKIESTLPAGAQRLIASDFVPDDPMYSDTKTPNLQSDTITQTLFYADDRNYSKELEKYPVLRPLYSEFLKKGDELNTINKKYNIELGIDYDDKPEQNVGQTAGQNKKSLLNLKKEYDTHNNNLYKIIQGSIKNGASVKEIMQDSRLNASVSLNQYINTKKLYLKKNAEVLSLFAQKVPIKNQYIHALIDFYKQLSNVKENERKFIQNKKNSGKVTVNEDHELFALNIIIECIHFDIKTAISILNNEGYLDYVHGMDEDIENIIQQITASAEQRYNIRDEFEKLYDNPEILKIEEYQYDIYYQNILLYSQQVDIIIWKNIVSETDDYFDTIKKDTIKNINDTFRLLKKYNDTYTPDERNAFLKDMDTAATPVQEQTMVHYLSLNKKQNSFKIQKQAFIELKKSEIFCYEAITIYSRVLVIQMARQISHLTVKDNINNINRIIQHTMTLYYRVIQDNIPTITEHLPHSAYWSTDNYDNFDILEGEIVTSIRNEQYNGIQLLYISQKMNQLEEVYKEAIDLLIPYISEMGVLKTCDQLTDPDVYLKKNPRMNTNEQAMTQFIDDFLNNEDKILTKGTNEQIMNIVLEQNQDGNAKNIIINNPEDLTKIPEWKVSFQYSSRKDNFFPAIVTALNGQLIMNQTVTLNKYARKPNNEEKELPIEDVKIFKFTMQQLRNSVAENINEADMQQYITEARNIIEFDLSYLNTLFDKTQMKYWNQLEKKIYDKWNKINFMFIYSFDETSKQVHSMLQNGDDYDTISSKLILDKRKLSDLMKIIKTPVMYIKDDYFSSEKKYYGDDLITLKIIERVFKIKIFVVNTHQESLSYLKTLGKCVLFRKQIGLTAEEETHGYIISQKISDDNKQYIKQYINSKNENLLEYMLDYQLFCLNDIKQILVDKDAEILNTNNNKAILHDLIRLINETIDILSLNNIPLPEEYTYFFINIFLTTSKVTDLNIIPFLNHGIFKIKKNSNIVGRKKLEGRLGMTNVWTFLRDKFKILLDKINNYLPKYVVETVKHERYEIQSNRIIELVEPFFNISNNPSNYYNSVADVGYLFLLKNKDVNNRPVYKNIFNSSDANFIFKVAEIPEYISYLIFRSLGKFYNINFNAPTYKTFAFRELFNTYKKNYIEKTTDIEVRQLPPISGMTEEDKLRRKSVVVGGMKGGMKEGIFMPNGVEIGGKSKLQQSYSDARNNKLSIHKTSNLSYYIIVDLDLYPGKDKINTGRKMVMACQNRYEKIRQAWAKLFNLVYLPSESYSLPPGSYKKREKHKDDRKGSSITTNYINNNYYNQNPSNINQNPSSYTRKNTNYNNNSKTKKNKENN